MELLNIKEYVQQEKQALRILSQGMRIKLGIIDGTDPNDTANQVYMRNKVKDFQEMGWGVEIYPVENVVQVTIDKAINEGRCTAVIVQLPLREELRKQGFSIPYNYDCDGFGKDAVCNPATPLGICMYLIKSEFNFEGKHAVVLGRSKIVGKPMAKMLLAEDCTVSVCHSKTPEAIRKYLLYNADLVISAAGKAGSLTRDDCPNAIVIDVGINRGPDGKLCGDFIEASNRVVMSTPVPGGVGLLTRLALLQNCFLLGERTNDE